MIKTFIATILLFGSTVAPALDGWWVCYGTPLGNPMGRRICGQGPDEYSARRWCGFEWVDISCMHN
jgi:hypothetical protein